MDGVVLDPFTGIIERRVGYTDTVFNMLWIGYVACMGMVVQRTYTYSWSDTIGYLLIGSCFRQIYWNKLTDLKQEKEKEREMRERKDDDEHHRYEQMSIRLKVADTLICLGLVSVVSYQYRSSERVDKRLLVGLLVIYSLIAYKYTRLMRYRSTAHGLFICGVGYLGYYQTFPNPFS